MNTWTYWGALFFWANKMTLRVDAHVYMCLCLVIACASFVYDTHSYAYKPSHTQPREYRIYWTCFACISQSPTNRGVQFGIESQAGRSAFCVYARRVWISLLVRLNFFLWLLLKQFFYYKYKEVFFCVCSLLLLLVLAVGRCVCVCV